MNDHGGCPQVELIEQGGHARRVAIVGVPVKSQRLVRASKAGKVRREAAEPGLTHGRDHLSPQEGPRRLTMKEHDRWTLALVEVGEPKSVEFAIGRAKGEVREALQELVRRADR